jgi:methyl-accepting chemotaxis protein
MMTRKIIGITFIVAAIFGLIFSIAGIALVWGVKAPLTANLVNAIDLIDTTLEATSSGLVVVDDTLTRTILELNRLENTVQTASKGVDDSVPMVESLSGLLSGSIPQAIETTQTGLTTLQGAAGTLESTLQLLTSIPFLPIENYAPEVPFTTALEDVSLSLDAIPVSLGEMEETLNTTQGNLTMLAAQVRIISRGISDLKADLYEIQLVLEQYQNVIAKVQEKVDAFRANMFTIITVTAWLFTIIFIWLGIAQIGLLTQGLERVNWPPAKQMVEGEEPLPINSDSEEGQALSATETILEKEESPPEIE